jgi:hypothetical protein
VSLALLLVLASSPALAAPSARLVYVREPGAEGCADEEGLRRAVAARLGYDPFFPWAKVTVLALVRKEATGYRAEVSLVDEASVSRGRRALTHEGDSCAPLVGALALTISLALDPLSLTQPPAGKKEETPPPAPPAPPAVEPPAEDARSAPPASPPSTSPVEPPVPPPPPPTFHGWASLAGLGSLGVTPGVAFGGLLRGKVERGPFSVGLEASATAPTAASAPSGGQVQAWLAEGTLLGCGRLSVVVGCGFVSAGPLAARGVGLATTRTAILAYGGAGPRLGVEVPLGERFRLEAFTQVAFAMVPRALQVDGMTVFRQPIAAGSLGVGASARVF